MGPLGSTGDDTSCLIDDMISSFPQLVDCDKVSNTGQKTWNFVQVKLQAWTKLMVQIEGTLQENGQIYCRKIKHEPQ